MFDMVTGATYLSLKTVLSFNFQATKLLIAFKLFNSKIVNINNNALDVQYAIEIWYFSFTIWYLSSLKQNNFRENIT